MIAEASWTFLLPVSYPSETNKIYMSIFLSARPIRNQFRIANLSKNQPLSTLNTHDITLSDRYLPTSFPQTSKKYNNNFSSSSRCLLSSKPARQISKHHIPTSKPSTNRTYSKSLVLSICLSTPLWRSPVLKQDPL
jgi:hypothetical protein